MKGSKTVVPKYFKSVGIAATALLMLSSAFAQTVTVPTQQIIGIPAGATIPRVVSTSPTNMSESVGAGARDITINFDQPMDVAAFFWNIPQTATFPRLRNRPYWTNGNRTLVMPVQLAPSSYYEIPLNVDQQNFRAATGVPLQPAKLQFWTMRSGVSGMSTPVGGGTRFTPTSGRRPAAGVGLGGIGGGTGGGFGGVQATIAPTPGPGSTAVPTPVRGSSGGLTPRRAATPAPTSTP